MTNSHVPLAARAARCGRGFTLVELLVVIAIVGILVATMLPAIQAAREAARRVQCSHNLGQLIVAVHNYEMAFGVYPPGTQDKQGPIRDQPSGYHHSWITQLLPFLEQQNTYRQIDRQVGVYDEKNREVRLTSIATLECPSQWSAGPHSSYAAVHHDVEAPIDVDNHGVFFLNSRVTYDDVTDGSAYTLFLGEKTLEQGDRGWMSGTRATLRNTGTPINPPGLISNRNSMPSRDFTDEPPPATDPAGKPLPAGGPLPVGGFQSMHPAGCVFAFGDGRVSFVTDSLDTTTYQRLGHRADGQPVSTGGF